MRSAQCERDGPRIGDRRERAPAQAERQDQRADAIGADPAVAHDLELALAGAAAAEPVGGIGKAVLVQRAGDEGGRGQREQGGKVRRQTQQARDLVDQGAGKADQHSRDWKSPGRACDSAVSCGLRRCDGEDRDERCRHPEIGNDVLEKLGARYHFSFIGRPATTNSASSAAAAMAWFMNPAASRKLRASALSGTMPRPTSLVTKTTGLFWARRNMASFMTS